MLYPLKFTVIFKEKLWGGQKLRQILNKNAVFEKTGESWELSGLQQEASLVSEGLLANNSLREIIEVYMGDLAGEPVYAKYGNEFPLLVKFIDAADDLSVQVHPDDHLAQSRYGQNGKTELWYIIDAEKDSELILGFCKELTKEDFLHLAGSSEFSNYLYRKNVKPGDAFYIPAGLVHSIGKGILIAEIQQSSDITYRIDDRNRTDTKGKKRELHVQAAADAINFDLPAPEAISYCKKEDFANSLVQSPYFSVNYIKLTHYLERDYNRRESFTIYVCIKGNFVIEYSQEQTSVTFGETVLLPASIPEVKLRTHTKAEILEVFLEF